MANTAMIYSKMFTINTIYTVILKIICTVLANTTSFI